MAAKITKRKITIDFINKYFKTGMAEGKITKEEHDAFIQFVKDTYAGKKTLEKTNKIKAKFIADYFPQLNDEDIGAGDFI
jgi:hypothetical protein